ncbi:MAG: hypothetical protein N3D73_00295 [Candidatus Diapherotrites archaeon]|nr:hypothetical protein [Candidatus Diapherotrites archaeon]
MNLSERLKRCAEKNNLFILEKISKGWSSEIYKAMTKESNLIAIKIEKDKSKRNDMCLKEYENLKKANSVEVGPKVYFLDRENRAIGMELIEGIQLREWLFKEKINKEKLKFFLERLFSQAKKLDDINLSHGQLAKVGKNILVRRNCNNFEPVIIDFEKASSNRKARNTKQLACLLITNKNSKIAKKVREILELKVKN